MSDPLVSERSLSFGEPPGFLARDFNTEIRTFTPQGDPSTGYGPSSRFTISINNMSQADFVDASRCYLHFTILAGFTQAQTDIGLVEPVYVDHGAGGDQEGFATTGDYFNVFPIMQAPTFGFVTFPGCPKWGNPFISGCSVQVPGLAIRSLLREPRHSQMFYSSRLLASGGVGQCEPFGMVPEMFKTDGKHNFSISGMPQMAGAKALSTRVRATAVSTCIDQADFQYMPTGIADQSGFLTRVRASVATLNSNATPLHYSIPLSSICHLFNGTSSLIPIAYFSAGSDNMTFTISTATVADALCNSFASANGGGNWKHCSPATYILVAPEIRITVLRISNSAVLSEITNLFSGLASLPLSPKISVPQAMVLKSINYTDAFVQVDNARPFQVFLTAGQPSMRGIMMRVTGDPTTAWNGVLGSGTNILNSLNYSTNGIDHANEYLMTPYHRLSGLQIRIGAYRVPLDQISAFTYIYGNNTLTVIPGVAVPEFLNPNFLGGPTVPLPILTIDTINRENARLHEQTRHLFSLFIEDTDEWSCAPVCGFEQPGGQAFSAQSRVSELLSKASFWSGGDPQGQTAPVVVPPHQKPVYWYDFPGSSENSNLGTFAYGDNCFGWYCFPFETFPSVYGAGRTDAFTNRGIDVRSLAQISVFGTVSKAMPGIISSPELSEGGYGDSATNINVGMPIVPGWEVRIWGAFDALATMVPGRIETESQFSLLPTGI